MIIAVLAALLGLLIVILALGSPQLVARLRMHPEDNSDTEAYLKSTGKTGADIAAGNSRELARKTPHSTDGQPGDGQPAASQPGDRRGQ